MARLSTHVLDTAAGVRIDLSMRGADGWQPLTTVLTDADGRTDEPLLSGPALATGHSRIEFHVGDDYRKRGAALAAPAFVDSVPIDFGIADAAGHYHVPLQVWPWSDSTSRGN